VTRKEKPKVLVTVGMEHLPESRAILERGAKVTYAKNLSKAKLLRLIPAYDTIVTNLRQRIDRNIIDAGTKLRVIATPSTGTDHIDLAYAKSRGIEVQSLKYDYTVLKTISSTAEHAFLLMMACLRKLPFAFDDVKKGKWTAPETRGREVADRIVGIIGYGRLGEIFSKFAHAFAMQVIACDPFKKIQDEWVEQVKMHELLKRSEIITLHVHLAPETRGLIGAREFALMRDGVYFVNTSRGALLDEKAFLHVLRSGKIACAGIDVLANEIDGRIADDPLVRYARSHRNLIITPHIGGCTYDAQEKAFRHTVRKLVAFLKKT